MLEMLMVCILCRPIIYTFLGTWKEFMEIWLDVITKYRPHKRHVNFHKNQLLRLRNCRNPNICRAHVDYIQNINIQTWETIQSQHFGQKQVTLLIITFQWYISQFKYINNFRFVGEDEHIQYTAVISTYTKHDPIFSKESIETTISQITLPSQIKFIYWDLMGHLLLNQRMYSFVILITTLEMQ